MRLNIRKSNVALVLLILALTSLGNGVFSASTAAPGKGPALTRATSLVVSIVPPRLPADGKTYSNVVVSLVDRSGNPSLALNDTVVTAVVGPVCAASLADVGVTPKIHAPKGTMGALMHAIAERVERDAGAVER